MAKLKYSTCFLQFFFQLSPNFPNEKTELFPSPVGKCLQEHWEGQVFLLQWILPVKNASISAEALIGWSRCDSISCTASASVTDKPSALCLTQCKLSKTARLGTSSTWASEFKSGNAPPESSTQLQKHQCCWHWDGNDSRSEFWWNRVRDKTENLPRVGPQASIKHHQGIIFLVCSWMHRGRFLSKRGSKAQGSQRHFPWVLKVNVAEALWLSDYPRRGSKLILAWRMFSL